MKTKLIIPWPLERGIYAVWDDIGSDAMALDGVDNEAAVEACIDADRLLTFGHPHANAELCALLEDHTYGAVLKALAKKIKLI